jgi:hypothetical protein
MTDTPTSETPAASTEVAPVKKGRFVKGVSGNPAGRPKGTRNKITLMQLDTEAALRDFLQPRAIKILRKAVEIAMNDSHPGQVKMLQTLMDKTMSSLRNQDVGDAKDTSVTVVINDMTAPARARAARTAPAAVEGEFTPVPALEAPTVSVPLPSPKTQTLDHEET